MLLRLPYGKRVSSVRYILNRRLEWCVIIKPQCLSIFRFELQQGLDLKVQGGSGYSCHTLLGKRRDLLSRITQKENELDNLERRFAVGHINEKMWKKYTRITQEEIKEIELKLENLPSKKSNLAILNEKILSLLENPRQFWESINTKQKRRLQDVLFPDGLCYSPKTTEYRTSNIHLLLEITSCFIDTWTSEKNKTRRQNVFGSRVVAEAGLEPTTFGLWARRATNCSTPRYCDANIGLFLVFYQTNAWTMPLNTRLGSE